VSSAHSGEDSTKLDQLQSISTAIGIISGTANLVNEELVEERVRVGWYSVIAALGAGIAGTIAIVRAAPIAHEPRRPGRA
jgi:hypothetical protein